MKKIVLMLATIKGEDSHACHEEEEQCYVCSAGGVLELYQVTGETKWLQWCQQLQGTLDELFWDETGGKKQMYAC